MLNFKTTCAAVIALCGISLGAVDAKADTYIYHDATHNFTFSYPDTWRLNTVSGNERVRITPMHGDHNAACTMSVMRDGRLTIYPEKYMQLAVPITLDDSFWATDVLPNYENVSVHKYHPAAGLGQGFATSVQITWGGEVKSEASIGMIEEEGEADADMPIALSGDIVTEVEVVDIDMTDTKTEMVEHVKAETGPKRANMIASIYKDHLYMFKCEADVAAFHDLQPLFASITSSVRYAPRYAAYPTGFYRDFLSDEPLLDN